MATILDYVLYFNAGYAGLIVVFYMLSLAIPKAAFVARCLASYICMMYASLFGVFVSILLNLVGLSQIAQWATGRCFKYLMILTTGVTFHTVDPKGILKSTRPAVFIGNHQTELDVLMLGCVFPKYCSVTAKSSLRKAPVLGWFMSLSASIFIDRQNSKDARAAMAGASNEIQKKRQSVYMFPEGTRSYAKDPVLLPFKKGAFHLAVQAQVPIVPIVVANYSHVLWIKGLLFKSGSVPCKVLDPIPTKGLTAADVDRLTTETRDLMLKELIALTEEAQGRKIAVSDKYSGNGVAKATGTDMKVAAA
ncbi:hypothetical protein QBC37DRAFT_439528 [Rhypophila decipiens]|uniref:1-acyl-sn-glycerol-3-phosphate acyltransferase n=1 Tax=Rhypophila decipiens TaxID=261697 RepID=A0AAN7B9V9_9PEZI|nr:hypothetical protein QBC37DRAFT_439528 [Rhypophila decipiens]